MSLKTYLTRLQSKTPDRLFCISPPQSPSTTFTNTPVNSDRRCIVQSLGLLLLRRDKRQRRKFESHPTHDFLPLKQRLWLRSIFLRLKDVPKIPPKIILRDPKRDFWEGRKNTLCKNNYQICSPAIVSFTAPALTMDFQSIPLLIHVSGGGGFGEAGGGSNLLET